MIWNLILIETKKFFTRKKNIISLIVFCAFIFIYIFANISFDSSINLSKIDSYKQEIKSTQNSLKDLETAYTTVKTTKLKNMISYTKNRLDLLNDRLSARYSNDWKEELNAQLKIDKAYLEEYNSGYIAIGESSADVNKRITKNQFLYDNNIKPINEMSSMTAYNFIYLVNKDILPVLLIIIILLLSSDVVAAESDEGTFKTLLVQPISRSEILLSKLITVSILSIVSIFSILLVFFFILGFTKGFGSSIYPMEYSTASLSSFFTNSNVECSTRLISIKTIIEMSLLLNIILIIFISAFGVLVSTIFQNSTSAICTSIIIAISINIINNQLKFFDKISFLIPFTYSNTMSLLNGNLMAALNNRNVTYINGIIVLLFFTFCCYIVSALIFKKKDITC